MFISKINNYQKTSPAFTSNSRSVYKNGELLYKNKTNFFRDDLEWNGFIDFLDYKYKNSDKVNVINSACSDGAEPFSLALLLIEKFKAAASKFFPIKASDIDEEIINRAQNEPCNITDNELFTINKHSNYNLYKYFNITKPTDTNYSMGLLPKKTFKPNIEFKKSDILTELKLLEPKNNIIMCRNFWTYLPEQNVKAMVDIFKEKLDETSTVVIGELEKGWHFDKLLKNAGFKELPIENVFQKSE